MIKLSGSIRLFSMVPDYFVIVVIFFLSKFITFEYRGRGGGGGGGGEGLLLTNKSLMKITNHFQESTSQVPIGGKK